MQLLSFLFLFFKQKLVYAFLSWFFLPIIADTRRGHWPLLGSLLCLRVYTNALTSQRKLRHLQSKSTSHTIYLLIWFCERLFFFPWIFFVAISLCLTSPQNGLECLACLVCRKIMQKNPTHHTIKSHCKIKIKIKIRLGFRKFLKVFYTFWHKEGSMFSAGLCVSVCGASHITRNLSLPICICAPIYTKAEKSSCHCRQPNP